MSEINILLVEDNEGDIILTTEAFRDTELDNRMSVVRSAEEALHFLNKEGRYAGAPTPQLILMDINLPGMDGKELLEKIKAHSAWHEIPVVMLTCSDEEDDISDCYNKNVNWYITKPIDYEKYSKVMHEIEAFYISFIPYHKEARQA